MHAADGILTSPGGMTSHAAVVARGMGKPCVAGAGDVRIDAKAGTLVVRGTTVKTGEVITLDGCTGEVILGVVPTVQPELSGDFAELMAWADEVRTLGIRANAETPADARPGARVRRRGHRPLPHRAHVLRGRPHRRRAPDDPGRRREGPPHRAGQDPADAAPGLRRAVRDHGRPAGHHPPARSAAARVPAQDAGRHGGRGQGPRRRRRGDRGARSQAARVQPDARPSRLPARHLLSRDLRDAGARDLRGRRRGAEEGRQDRDPRDHDPAGRDQEGARPDEGRGRPGRRRRSARCRARSSSTWSAP